MKRILLIGLLALAALALTSCVGEVYLSFDWSFTPYSFDTNDTRLPSTIYRGEEYETSPGSYYFTTYWDTGVITFYTIYYTLDAYTGFLPDDALYEIYCWYDDFPEIYQYQSVVPPTDGGDSIPRATEPPAGKKEILYSGEYNPPRRGSGITGRIEIGIIVPED
jgi:hypothetical protein